MQVKELIQKLQEFDGEQVVICQDENLGWENIIEVHDNGVTINIVFGDKSPWRDQ